MNGKELEKFDEDESNFEKFTKKQKALKDKKKSLRDYRDGNKKREFPKEEKREKYDKTK